MAGYTKNHRTPLQLTAVARAAFRATLDAFPNLQALFPVVPNFTLDYEFNAGASFLPAAASFRSFDTESQVGETGSAQTSKGKLPPTSIRLHVDEVQQLQMYGQNEAIGQKFEDYADQNARSIAYRAILGAGEALSSGKVSIDERKMRLDVNFGRPARLDATAASGFWTAAGSSPLSDLDALRLALGKRVAQTTFSRKQMNALQRNAEMISFIQPGVAGATRVSTQDVIDFLASEGYGRIVIDETVVPNKQGVEVPVFDEKKVIMTAGGTVGTIDLGVTAESIQQANGISASDAPGLFSGAIETTDPEGYDVLVAAILLPVLRAPLNTATLKALA
jgi:acyl dehydratase